jgi:hypothetical protein
MVVAGSPCTTSLLRQLHASSCLLSFWHEQSAAICFDAQRLAENQDGSTGQQEQ